MRRPLESRPTETPGGATAGGAAGVDASRYLAGTLPWGFSAHPKRDPLTGDLHAVAYYWAWGNKVQYLVVGADGKVRRVLDVTLPAEGSPMMHDLSITETRAVLYDLPCIFDLK